MHGTRLLACTLVLVGLAAGSVGTASEPRVNQQLQAWSEQLVEIHRHLAAGEWKLAEKKSNVLIRGLARRLLIRGSDLIGTALLQRAVGLEAQGRHREALWDAFAADALSTKARSLLARYGTHGAALLEELVTDPEEPELDLVAESGLGQIALSSTTAKPDDEAPKGPETIHSSWDVLAPTKLSGADPSYPEALRRSGISEFIIVQVVVDEQGRPGRPEIVKGGAHPALLLNTLEAMKEWRFKPAKLAGQPVQVYYTLTVNFKA